MACIWSENRKLRKITFIADEIIILKQKYNFETVVK